MKELLITIAQGLVEDPSAVSVDVDAPDEEGTTVYHLHVAQQDICLLYTSRRRMWSACKAAACAAHQLCELLVDDFYHHLAGR